MNSLITDEFIDFHQTGDEFIDFHQTDRTSHVGEGLKSEKLTFFKILTKNTSK